MADTRALDRILSDEDVPPYECDRCPFAQIHICIVHDEPNWADPGEGYYTCELLGAIPNPPMSLARGEPNVIWGENPACDRALWVKRARADVVRIAGVPV